MALEQANVYGEDGQHVVISGGVLAQSVQSEGYESQTMQEYAEAAGIRADSDFINNPAGTIQWPFAVGVHIGDRFGYRDCYGCSSDHGGQDFNPGLGAEIQAIADGTVVESTDEGGSLGVVMMIDHIIDGELITSVYAHMEYGSRRFEVGDTVEVADVLGTTGIDRHVDRPAPALRDPHRRRRRHQGRPARVAVRQHELSLLSRLNSAAPRASACSASSSSSQLRRIALKRPVAVGWVPIS